MAKIINSLVKPYLKFKYHKIEHFMNNPHEVQHDLLSKLLSKGEETLFGRQYNFSDINNPKDFGKYIPVHDYETMKPYILQMMMGETDILWPGETKWFAKSSGTTSDKSKFIPVTNDILYGNHVKGSWDSMAILYNNFPDAQIFSEKNLIMGGSIDTFQPHPATKYGDISAIMIEHMPSIGAPFYTPDFKTALLPNWDEKIQKIAEQSIEQNVVMFGGVPTWTIVLFKKILEMTGKDNMLEVWPNLQAYLHGGVGFEPYVHQFKQFIPKDDFIYKEIYNASEGYFGIQNDYSTKDMLLMLDNDVYYEFIPFDEMNSDITQAIPLEDVVVNKTYAIVITTSSGLWRYMPGDLVTFTSTNPYKIIISGRTKHFINAFGEEVMVGNTDKAISLVSDQFHVDVLDYTAGPLYMSDETKGGHEWLIEFEKTPDNLVDFSKALDLKMQELNSDYEAKRYKNMALQQLIIVPLPKDTFMRWLKSVGKFGAQNKIPRLSNDRKIIDQIKLFIQSAN